MLRFPSIPHRCLKPAWILAGGLLLTVAGALWNRISGFEATAELRPGAMVTEFQSQRGGRTAISPSFQVRLDQLDIASRPDYRLFAYVHPDGKGGYEPNPTVLELQEGKTMKLPKGFQVEVERLIPNAMDHGRWGDNPKAAANPVMGVMLGLGLPDPLGGQLFALDPARCRQDEPGGRFAVIFRPSVSPDFMASLKPRPPLREKLVLAWKGQVHEFTARAGSRYEHEGLTLNVVRAYPDFAVRQGPNGPEAYTRSPEAREPWLEVQLTQPGSPDRKLLLSARDPLGSDRLNAPNLPLGMLVRYVRVGEEAQRTFVVFSFGDRQVRLIDSGRVLRQELWSLEHPFVVNRGLSVTPMTLLERAEYVPDFIPADSKSTVPEHPVVRVRVAENGSENSDGGWLEALGAGGVPTAATFLGGRVALIYRARDPEPRDYKGMVSVLDARGQQLLRGEVSLKKNLQVGGLRLGLGDQVPEDPAAMALCIRKKPGQWFIYAGWLAVLVGASWAFLALFFGRSMGTMDLVRQD